MTYYSHQDKELSQAGIREGELGIYTGTVNSRQANCLSPNPNSSNAYVYLWKNGRSLELDAYFQRDMADLDVLEVRAGEEKYTFLRDKPSGYIRQVAGPAEPIIVANFGAIPLRVDTFLGKFTVHAGTMLRLDENAPQREKKKVLLTVSSQYERPLKSADLWDGGAWRPLNICEGLAFNADAGLSFTVRDGSAIVQCMAVIGNWELLMMDAPEPEPDYEIYVAGQIGDKVNLCFDRRDYQGGQVVQRSRTITFSSWGEPVVYDLQKLRESRTGGETHLCEAELPKPSPEGETHPAPGKRAHPLISSKLKEFLEIKEEPNDPLLEPGHTSDENQREADGLLEALPQLALQTHGTPAPEPPENFPALPRQPRGDIR